VKRKPGVYKIKMDVTIKAPNAHEAIDKLGSYMNEDGYKHEMTSIDVIKDGEDVREKDDGEDDKE